VVQSLVRMAAPYTTGSMQVYDAPVSTRRDVAGLLPLYTSAPTSLRSVYLIGNERVTLGRDPEATICVEANAVSRRHCEVFPTPGGHGLRDLGSRNGTLVDGVFVSETSLQGGELLRIGDALFKYLADGAPRYAGYRLDGTMEAGAKRLAQQSTHLLGGAIMDGIVSALERIAPTMLSVIVRGESGTGKEVAAREIHRLSGRRGAFVALNCAALPGSLLESELFGYRKGAFSGADRDKIGLVKAANGGTLFLDEIGDMSPEAQAKLLRVLQSREVLPLGATQAEPVDVRVICATHRDLTDLQLRGLFRGDLYARLHEYGFTLPPLRDRKEDIWLLTQALLARHGRPDLQPTFPFMLGLLAHQWPYNVRELEACVKRAIALSTSLELLPDQLPDEVREALSKFGRRSDVDSAPPASPNTTNVATPSPHQALAHAPVEDTGDGDTGSGSKAPTEAELRGLLAQHRGNIAAVGRALGKERMQIHRWMKRYGVDINDYRAE
jgi:sigma-54 dependent transcriptional regulator, acetoin dehydrogenase operon transcriptional activator AcoR